jgi:hypothetical protein
MIGKTLSPADANLDVRHLHPKKVACTALAEAGVRTLGDLAQLCARPQDYQGTFSVIVTQHLDDLLGRLDFFKPTGRLDWDAYHRDSEEVGWPLFFTSEALQKLVEEERNADIGAVVAGSRVDSLRRAGLATVGAVVDAARIGISKVENFGPQSLCDLWAGLKALSTCVRDNGRVRWDHVGSMLAQALVPKERQQYGAGVPFNLMTVHDALDELAEVWSEASTPNLDAVTVLRKRILEPEECTLEEVAALLPGKPTRGRVQQIEAEVLESIRRSIYHNDHAKLGARFRQDFRRAWKEASRSITSALGAFMDRDPQASVIAQVLDGKLAHIRPRLRLYRALFIEAEPAVEPGMPPEPESPSVPQVQPAVPAPVTVGLSPAPLLASVEEEDDAKARRMIATGEPDVAMVLYARLFVHALREWATATGRQPVAGDPDGCIREALAAGVFPDVGMAEMLRQKTWRWLLTPSTVEDRRSLRMTAEVYASQFDLHLRWLRQATVTG